MPESHPQLSEGPDLKRWIMDQRTASAVLVPVQKVRKKLPPTSRKILDMGAANISVRLSYRVKDDPRRAVLINPSDPSDPEQGGVRVVSSRQPLAVVAADVFKSAIKVYGTEITETDIIRIFRWVTMALVGSEPIVGKTLKPYLGLIEDAISRNFENPSLYAIKLIYLEDAIEKIVEKDIKVLCPSEGPISGSARDVSPEAEKFIKNELHARLEKLPDNMLPAWILARGRFRIHSPYHKQTVSLSVKDVCIEYLSLIIHSLNIFQEDISASFLKFHAGRVVSAFLSNYRLSAPEIGKIEKIQKDMSFNISVILDPFLIGAIDEILKADKMRREM